MLHLAIKRPSTSVVILGIGTSHQKPFILTSRLRSEEAICRLALSVDPVEKVGDRNTELLMLRCCRGYVGCLTSFKMVLFPTIPKEEIVNLLLFIKRKKKKKERTIFKGK